MAYDEACGGWGGGVSPASSLHTGLTGAGRVRGWSWLLDYVQVVGLASLNNAWMGSGSNTGGNLGNVFTRFGVS